MRFLLMFELCFFVNGASALGALDYDSIWRCDENRFNWYCDIQPDTEQAQTIAESCAAPCASSRKSEFIGVP
jgi:hypothetical protein